MDQYPSQGLWTGQREPPGVEAQSNINNGCFEYYQERRGTMLKWTT